MTLRTEALTEEEAGLLLKPYGHVHSFLLVTGCLAIEKMAIIFKKAWEVERGQNFVVNF